MADEKKVKAAAKAVGEDSNPPAKKAPAAKKEAAPKAEKSATVKKETASKTEKPAAKTAAKTVGADGNQPETPNVKEEKPAEVQKVPAAQILSKPIVSKGPVPKKSKAAVELDPDARNFRKEREGIVVSNKMQKTIVVEVRDRAKHPLYKKTVNKTKRIKAHDENNECGIGDTVAISECRPLSKDKHWRLVTILEKAK